MPKLRVLSSVKWRTSSGSASSGSRGGWERCRCSGMAVPGSSPGSGTDEARRAGLRPLVDQLHAATSTPTAASASASRSISSGVRRSVKAIIRASSRPA